MSSPCSSFGACPSRSVDFSSPNSDYAAKVFGFTTFGTVYGTIICLSGLFTFAQSALQAITHDAFNGNPTPVNIALAGLGLVIGVILVAFVALKGRTVQQEHAEEDERRSLLPRPSTQNLRPNLADYRTLSTVQETPDSRDGGSVVSEEGLGPE